MITAARLRELLNYDPETGVFTWRADRRYGRTKAGDVAGCLCKTRGYIHIRLDGRLYYGHRLAWLYVHGVWPAGRLDHRDTDGDNNRLTNLRPATQSQNRGNSRRSRRNASGVKGVYLDKRTGRWVAEVQVGGRRRYLGSFALKADAGDAYCEAAKEAFGEFARAA